MRASSWGIDALYCLSISVDCATNAATSMLPKPSASIGPSTMLRNAPSSSSLPIPGGMAPTSR